MAAAGELVCCGQAMNLLTENTVDAAKEKHVPVIEKVDGGYKVKVGEVAPSQWKKSTWIEWIELIADGSSPIVNTWNPGASAPKPSSRS